eukprot:GFUD01023046.1.p1 GENE.GFUD01023046.1~~GFUD01023046.1.p1  ORF type:complete len:643 (+),score=159.62 GFUD01023046.1:102-2030(+)
MGLIEDLLIINAAKYQTDTGPVETSPKYEETKLLYDEKVRMKKKIRKDKRIKKFATFDLENVNVVKKIKIKYENVKTEAKNKKTKYSETNPAFLKFKTEYTETKPTVLDLKMEADKVKKECPEVNIPEFTTTGVKIKGSHVQGSNQKKQKEEGLMKLNEWTDSEENSDDVKRGKLKIKKEYTETETISLDKIKKQYRKETNYMLDIKANTKHIEDLNEGKVIIKKHGNNSIIKELLEQQVAKYTEKHELQVTQKDCRVKEKQDNKQKKIHLKELHAEDFKCSEKLNEWTESEEDQIKKEYTKEKFDNKANIVNNEELIEDKLIDKKDDDESISKEACNHQFAKYTEKHDIEAIKKEKPVYPDDKHKGKEKSAIKLKKIHWKKQHAEDFENEDDSCQNKVYRRQGKVKAFSPEEDEVLINAMATFGDKISVHILSKQLDRSRASIRDRIIKLKTGKRNKERRAFSLSEDIMIMDRVLENLPGHTLEEINLHNDGTSMEVATALSRKEVSPRNRWGNQLKPWILQHYSGTLNLNIRIMLANYLADNFNSIDSIDWPFVANRPEFVGHTQGSLRSIFFAYLFRSTKLHLKLESSEISLKNIADNTNEAYGDKNSRKITENVLTRQKQVINYFEQYVKKHGITNFL